MIVFGLGLAFFYNILLLTKKNKSRVDYLLFSWMLFISIHLFFFYASENNLYKQYPHLIGVDLPFPIFQALFLYFYIRMLTSGHHRFIWYDILHLLPSIAAYIYMIPFFMKDGTEKYIYFQEIEANEKVFLSLFTLVAILSAVIYILLAFRMLKKYKYYIQQYYSFTNGIHLKWIKQLIIGMSAVWLVVLCIKVLQLILDAELPYKGETIISISATLFVFFLGYFGIRQTTIFSNLNYQALTENNSKSIVTQERYKRSGLKNDQIASIKEKLLSLMESEKRYMENELTLDALANDLDISSNNLSQVINEHFSKNFYDFINYYRIEDFKRKAADVKYKNFSIIALALECGFNSKSAFYNVFKKQVGISPGEYLKNSVRK